MMKKKWLSFIGIPLLLMIFIIVYWYYFSKPEPFPTNEQLLTEINNPDIGINAVVIQDILPIDKRHVFVPFISEEGKHGISSWEWKHRKWKVGVINDYGELLIWKIDDTDPNTYHFIWNLPPQEQISYVKIYLKKDRAHYGTDNIHHYEPAVQMEQKIELGEKTYGSLQVPKEWVSVIALTNELNADKQPQWLFDVQQNIYYGWNSFDKLDNISYIENSLGVSSSWNDSMDIEYLMRFNESNIENP